MNLDLLKYQTKQIEYLKNAKKNNRLTHAYIFEGPRGVGKNELAHYFACMLYSNSNVDLNSNEARLILNDEFLNVYTIYPKNKSNTITKDQILSLKEEFSYTSQIKGPRIYIINDVDTMNVSSANSLLKFIEEPQDELYGVLLTTNSKKILPTILSRCQLIRLNELDANFIRKELINKGLDNETSSILSHITNDVFEAERLYHDNKIQNLIELFKDFFKLDNEVDKVKYFETLKKTIGFDKDLAKYYISLLILVFEDLIYLYNDIDKINFEIYIDNLEKLKNTFDINLVREKIMYLYKLNNLLNNTNVSVYYILTSLSFNLI